jgi:N-formylglutamate amidohydrolase
MYPETILPIAAHIPHAGTEIPDAVRNQFLPYPGELWREVAMVTDWYTDELFGIPGIAVSQTPISRVVVDLERYTNDDIEDKAVFGQGVIYTHNTLGEQIRRKLSNRERSLLLDNYYRPWHLNLELNVEQQLARWGTACCWTATVFLTNPSPTRTITAGPAQTSALAAVATRPSGCWTVAGTCF